ncbi:protoporphyrinogen/coproporphyrinogen oxidase [Micromonospora sp. NPDC048898]|uniref:protoporphyrinogen/coproporphyrinogen oxidase n=1 Tax=Micromonospora sp. NPDC048898 TaxID=3364260 RepID=UPI00371AF2C2
MASTNPKAGEHVVLGAGPCGLAAARELRRGGRTPIVVEREESAGGLASSFSDDRGFVWDLGAHVAFSPFGDFDELLDDMMGDDVLRHERSSYVVYGGRWVPYPFQHNLAMLPTDEAVECMVDLIERPRQAVRTFDDWIMTNFGAGVANRFMRPYNAKVWTVPCTEMSADWIAERVATVNWRTALANLVHGRVTPGWGPNSTFSYPGRGGIGEPFRRLADQLPDVRYGRTVTQVDPHARTVTLGNGDRLGFHQLISTIPLTALVAALTDCPVEVRDAARALRHNQVLVVGVGATGTVRTDWHWLYFPEQVYPFYRITNIGLCSARNLPEPHDGHVSFMAEIAQPAGTPWPDAGEATRDTIRGLVRSGLLPHESSVVSTFVRRVPLAYPIPTLDRTEAVATILRYLESHQIYSRGRFGVWMYEHGNMDHAVRMGKDVARYLLSGAEELVRLPHMGAPAPTEPADLTGTRR